MKLIDVDELLRTAKEDLTMAWQYALFERMVSKYSKAVDAEPVVRCKDCKYWGEGKTYETDDVKFCRKYVCWLSVQNDYCVHGEKR